MGVPAVPPPAGPGPGDDWPRQATDQIVRVVDQVRDKTTGPAIRGVHVAVFGIVAAIAASIVAYLGYVALLRVAEQLLWGKVWVVYLIIGTVLSLAGLICWAKRPAPSEI